eukprot:TRINITY_DN1240_c0_g2_i1.p2 TRINITY_DN1240_c0_g2~~TRINITY_DN1240_c0_g2_i1.p2  ORF type:complete len:368 (-),score=254.08 TRINITY_DN1240_c0_g2_i1:31-1134(-)
MVESEQMSDAVFSFVLRNEGDADAVAAASGIAAEHLQQLRREFTYWYPWNLRTSGRDLAYNHLPFSLFHHAAFFPPEQWPLSIQCCAFLEVDGDKMSKSKGNFLTVAQSLARFSSSSTRLTLADAGDSIDVANFDQSVAANRALVLESIARQVLLLAPIVPHVAEHVWRRVLGRDGFASTARMPLAGDVDTPLLLAADYFDAQLANARSIYGTATKPRKGKPVPPPTALVVRVCTAYAPWQARVLELLTPLYDDATKQFADGAVATLQADEPLRALIADAFPPAAAGGAGGKKKKKQKSPALIFFGALRPLVAEAGRAALALTLPFDETDTLRRVAPVLQREFKLANVSVETSEDGQPGRPSFIFSS